MKPVFIRQQDETDCGAACLAMISRHYGKFVGVQRVRKLAGTDLMGTSGLGIVRGARALGFSCKGVMSDIHCLPEDLPLPCIAHIKKELLDHYVVIYRVQRGRVFVADPGKGLAWKALGAFLREWSGVLFILGPDKDFKPASESKGLFSRYIGLLVPHRRLLGEVVLASLILSVLGIAATFFFRILIDEVLVSGLETSLLTLCLGYLFLIFFQACLGLARSNIMMHIANRIDARLITDYFSHILRLPAGFFRERKVGEVLSRIGDASMVRQAISGTTLTLLLDSLMLVAGTFMLFSFGSALILAVIAQVLISSAVAWLFSSPYRNLLQRKAVIDAEKHSFLVESISGIDTIKALSMEDIAYNRAEERIVGSIKKGLRLGGLGNMQGAVQAFVSHAGTLAIYWFGSLMILRGRLSLGELISFNALSVFFLGPLTRLLSLQPTLQEAFVAADRLGEVMEEKTEDEGFKLASAPRLKGDIHVRSLSFSYGTRGRTLEGINLVIAAGEKVGIVGPSGSGKSTLARLLMKFYSLEEGSIEVDGIDIRDFETKSYREQIGYVPQEILLFSGTVAENISWGREDASPAEIVMAAEAAGAREFIERLPDRYATKVGERGASLSGGERQRIALARIILRRPRILILDEATSSLDAKSERSVMATVQGMSQDITTIIIAHRLSTVKECDRILVMTDGRIVESGRHDNLLASGGPYAELWRAQSDGVFAA